MQSILKAGYLSIGVMLFVSICSIRAQDSLPKLAGRVTEAGNGAPIEGATITLEPPIAPGNGIFQTAETDSKGNYRFNQVRNGTYSITVSADGFVSQYYTPDAKLEHSFLRFDSSTNIQGIDFKLVHEAVIGGTVVDKGGKPVANLPVAAWGRPEYRSELEHIAGFQKTDVLGQFTFRSLPAASYQVCANESAWYNDGPVPRLHYRGTWYGGATSREGATPIVLKEGDERKNLRIVVEPEMQHQVIVRPSGPLGAAGPLRYELKIDGRNFLPIRRADGSYMFADLPPGHYTLITTAWAPVQYLGKSQKEIDVTDSDVTVQVRMGGLGEIAGTVNWAGGHDESSDRALFMIESEEGVVNEVRVNPRGHFDVLKVLPGKYRFIPSPGAPVAVLRSVQCGGKEVTDDSPLQIGARQKVLDCNVTLGKP